MDEEHASMAIFGNFDPVIPPKEFICFENVLCNTS